MRALIDSSVWIDFLHGVQSPRTARLKELLAHELAIVGDLVLLEVLQGIRSDRQFAVTRQKLLELPILAIGGADAALAAAANYRRLRTRGITVRKTVDNLIATRCILDDLELLYSDRDFDPFVEHLGLRPAWRPNA